MVQEFRYLVIPFSFGSSIGIPSWSYFISNSFPDPDFEFPAAILKLLFSKFTSINLKFPKLTDFLLISLLGERPYKCDICSKAFRVSHHLREHRTTHSTERPWICNLCQKTFSSKLTLYKHTFKSKCSKVNAP